MSRKLYGYITNDEKPELTQNWDKKGNIYYTDSDGNQVDFNVNPLTKIKNNISAFGENFDRWLNRSDYDEDVQRQKRNMILGLETAPIGASEAVAGKLAGQLVPFLGKKVADYVAKGSLSGGLGNAAYEGLEAAFDNKNPLVEGLKGFGSGLFGGGAFGLGLGKLNKFIDRRNILKNNVQERLQQYWDDYIEGLSDNTKLGKQSLQSKEVADFRGLRQGINGGENQFAYDLIADDDIPKYIYEEYLKPETPRYYEGGYTSPKVNKILDYIYEGHDLNETLKTFLSEQYNADRITKIYDDFNNGVYKRIEAQPAQQVKRQVLNPEWRPKFNGSNFDEIIDDYNSRTETANVGRGYSGYSMSNNAISAYNKGSMPISKWTKQKIIQSISDISDTYNLNIDINALKKLKNDELKKYLIQDGYHHTSKYYNTTDFYKPNIYKLLGAE